MKKNGEKFQTATHSKDKVVNISEAETQNAVSEHVKDLKQHCFKIFRNFNFYFPIGILCFLLFWTGLLLKLYLPNKNTFEKLKVMDNFSQEFI